jgi:hypothetical protein
MRTIEYCANGLKIADAECEKLAREFLNPSSPHYGDISVSNSTFILAVRALIKEGVFPHTDARFLYDGQYLHPNKDGRMEDWPNGFCDIDEKLYFRLL